MRILEMIILLFTAIIMGGFIVDMAIFMIGALIDVLRDRRKK